MGVPSISVDSFQGSPGVYVEQSSQFLGAGMDSKNYKKPSPSSVVGLIGSRGPAAIIGRIALIIVLAFKRHSNWWMAHVGKETLKRSPFCAYGDSSSSIIVPGRIIWIDTPVEHMAPGRIGSGSLSNSVMAVLKSIGLFGFSCKASTGLGVSGSQIVGNDDGGITAITIAKAFGNLSAGFVDYWSTIGKHFKPSKAKANEGYFLRHGISLFNVVFSIGRRYMPLTDAKILMNPAM